MVIAYLRDYPQYIPMVAEWIYREFPHEFKALSLEEWTKQLHFSQTRGVTTMIVLENAQVLGTATLDIEDLPLRLDLSPWLASVYVPPEYRSRGLGSKLVEQVEHEAKKQGFSRIYLHTYDHEGFYAGRGWGVLERLNYWEKDLVVMVKNLDSMDGSKTD
jgi:GNAT superfamily N-acetyltransferase